ncbi:acetylcholinesterase [Hypoxylon trugodes]|uniref:acetylcholinesterase n=1 Tax=Hypoxylon trugodes TaxID=326681 RepID=UPI00218FA65B|nr:acetylcholinesterase [Hypoxylon trugodes]KAI1387600.1 acetylcholinesterase [Hypoxylon trugodes]
MANVGLHDSYLSLNSTFGTIRGFVNQDYPHVAQFLGIPFAEAPVGPRRWLPPVPKAPADHFDATEFGLSCPQWFGGPPSVYDSDVPEFSINDTTSEDCLSLSIWAPAEAVKDPPKSKLPVVVWIPGGAFLVGGSTVPYQNPIPWVEKSQRHIVVSVNYRLTIFGFPNAAGLAPYERNLGFLDQRLGLEWVHEHISSFGGDPSRITHFGQSAGARSVDAHSFQYPDKPLVRNQIINSGTALNPLPVRDTDHGYFTFVAESLGFEGDDPSAELEFMRQQSAEKLIEFIKSHTASGEDPQLSFRPVIDGFTLFDDFEERAKAGNFSKLPAIVGTTNEEGNALAPYNPDGVNKTAADGITNNFFRKPAAKIAQYRSEYAPTFRYLYKDPAPEGTASFPNISPRTWMRAYHSSDLPLIFGTHSWFRGRSTAREKEVSEAWQELYVVFAEEGPEGLRRLGWGEVGDGKAIVIGTGEKGWENVDIKAIDGDE